MRPRKPYQKTTLQFLQARPQAGLFLAPGTGKTAIAISQTIAGRTKLPALIICRRDDFLTWQIELAADGLPVPYMIDSGRTPLPSIQKLPSFTLVTYDLVKNKKIQAWIRDTQFRSVIADECQLLKRWSAKRTRVCCRSTTHIPYRLGLTGSPITNDPLDVFSIMLFIDKGSTFGQTEFAFKKRYYVAPPRGYGYGFALRRGAKKEIVKKLRARTIHIHEDDVLTLPPERHLIKAAPMSPQQRRLTKQILEEWEYALANGQTIEIDHVIVQVAKLRQIASGFMYVPGKNGQRETQELKCPKLELLQNLINEDLKDKPKVVIWCSHTAEIFRIAAAANANAYNASDSANLTHITYHGGMSRIAREHARKRFRDSRTRLFIGQVDMGIGMNELVVADTAIYYSNSTKVASRQQSMRRIRRIGSERHQIITYYDLVTEASIDLQLLTSVQQSMDLAQYILNQLKLGKRPKEILQ